MPRRMIQRILPHPIHSSLLLLVWLLSFNSLDLGVLLLGVVVAIVLPLGTRAFWPEAPQQVRLRYVPRLVLMVLWDIIVANLRVALLILGPQRRLRPCFLLVPLALESPFAITTLAGIITLTPGTVSANLSGDRRTLLVHALSETDPEGAVATIKQRYERPLRQIFE